MYIIIIIIFACADATNDLHLKIVPLLQEPPTVLSYHVPIFTCTREDITNVSWDLTIEQVRESHILERAA